MLFRSINTNIDLVYTKNFKFDVIIEFLKKNNFDFVLGLRNIEYRNNPSPEWTNKIKEVLKFNEINYDEYIIGSWPTPIPEFDVLDSVFILRYSYDEYCQVDQLASSQYLFENFMKSNWEKYYKDIVSTEKDRVIVFCNDIENLVLKNNFVK